MARAHDDADGAAALQPSEFERSSMSRGRVKEQLELVTKAARRAAKKKEKAKAKAAEEAAETSRMADVARKRRSAKRTDQLQREEKRNSRSKRQLPRVRLLKIWIYRGILDRNYHLKLCRRWQADK